MDMKVEHQNLIPEDFKPNVTPPRRVSPDEALQRLKDGNARYKGQSSKLRDYGVDRAERAAKQYPFAAVLSCADSRIAPELAFDQGPGDLFVVRVAGNFVNSDGLASLEYGVEFLGVGLIVVLGHTNCGAVDAAIKVVKQDADLPGALPALIGNIKPAVKHVLDHADHGDSHGDHDTLDACIRQNVRQNVEKLKRSEPLIAQRVQSGDINVVGAVYDIKTGTIQFLDA